MCLGYKGTNSPAFPEANIELAVAGNTEVIRAKRIKLGQIEKELTL
jgi:hypothetical protein